MSSSYEKEDCLEFFSLYPMLVIKEFFDLFNSYFSNYDLDYKMISLYGVESLCIAWNGWS